MKLKRVLAIVLALLMVLPLAACGEDKPAETKKTTGKTEAPAATTTTIVTEAPIDGETTTTVGGEDIGGETTTTVADGEGNEITQAPGWHSDHQQAG